MASGPPASRRRFSASHTCSIPSRSRSRSKTLPASTHLDARDRRVPHAFRPPGRPGVGALRARLRELDPVHASRSTLEVLTRRLLVEHGHTDFEREFPLTWNGRTYHYEFSFERTRTVLETNGRRWHDDPSDYEHDHEKWSVPGRLGYRRIFATWDKVTRHPDRFIQDLVAGLAA